MTQTEQPELGILTVEREFSKPVEEVFDAFTDPEKMSKWFFAMPGGSARIEQDLREGGKYRVEMIHPDKSDCASSEECDNPVHYGEYLKIDRTRLLVFTWINDGFVDYSEVTVAFEPSDSGTKLRLTHKVPADKIAAHNMGWNGCLDNLATFLL